MKKTFILLLLAFLIFFQACDNTSKEMDAETQEAAYAIAGEATMVSYMSMAYSMAASGFSQGMARPSVYDQIVPLYTGITISGSFNSTGDDVEGNFTITFADYTNGELTINGIVYLNFTGNNTTGIYNISATGELTGIYEGVSYIMTFTFDIDTTSTEMTVSGSIDVNGASVSYSVTQAISS